MCLSGLTVYMSLESGDTMGVCGQGRVGLSCLCDNQDQDRYSCRTEDKAEASTGGKT